MLMKKPTETIPRKDSRTATIDYAELETCIKELIGKRPDDELTREEEEHFDRQLIDTLTAVAIGKQTLTIVTSSELGFTYPNKETGETEHWIPWKQGLDERLASVFTHAPEVIIDRTANEWAGRLAASGLARDIAASHERELASVA